MSTPARAKPQATPVMGFWSLALWVAIAAGAFHAAYAFSHGGFLVALYLFALARLVQAGTWRRGFYAGLAVGFLLATFRLTFFWRIFSGGAVALWYVYAFWIGLFIALGGNCIRVLPSRWGWVLLPFLWCGLEYFRSELYYLRFSWLSPAFAFSEAPASAPLRQLGAYGLSFVLMGVAVGAGLLWNKSKIRSVAVLAVGCGLLSLWGFFVSSRGNQTGMTHLRIAGSQMEVPDQKEVIIRLTDLAQKYPDVELLVLSEYTFMGPIPQPVKDWCHAHRRYLVVGGEDPLPGGKFYNTSFVICPGGEIVFKQVKTVPIQFFKDGLPAPEQKVWESPWGKIGICICYDLSYTRVTDELVRQGARVLIVPTMDVEDWGRRQHELHARVAPLRAAEYGVPIFRLASSGISQAVDCRGKVVASAPCPGYGATLRSDLELPGRGRLPLDRWLAPFSTGVTAALALWLFIRRVGSRHKQPAAESAPEPLATNP